MEMVAVESVGLTVTGTGLVSLCTRRKMPTPKLPKLTADAKKRWEQIPAHCRALLLNPVWRSKCRAGTEMLLTSGRMEGRDLVLNGTCKKCGASVARVIEPEE